MSTPWNATTTIGIGPTDHADATAGHWPLLSERELNRLRFLAYCCATGRIRSPAPVRADVAALCDQILAALATGLAADRVPPDLAPWQARLANVPPTFAARRDC